MTVEKRLFERLHDLKLHVKNVLQDNTFFQQDLRLKEEKIDKLIHEIKRKDHLINELKNRMECLLKENKAKNRLNSFS